MQGKKRNDFLFISIHFFRFPQELVVGSVSAYMMWDQFSQDLCIALQRKSQNSLPSTISLQNLLSQWINHLLYQYYTTSLWEAGWKPFTVYFAI